jgi:hypothetical protein
VAKGKPGGLRWHHRVTLVIGAVSLVAIALSALSATQSSAGLPTVPASAVPQLRAAALRAARVNGDAHPASVVAVITSRANALRVATPGDTIPGSANEPVYLIVIKGNFTLTGLGPKGNIKYSGNYLALTYNTKTFQTLDFGISRSAPPVSPSSLGPVSTLIK